MTTIGPTVRWLREQRGWSQRELAKNARTSDATICRVEQGQDPTLGLVRRLARAFGVPVGMLLHPPRTKGQPPASPEEARDRLTAAVKQYLDTKRSRPSPAPGWVADDDLRDIERATLELVEHDPTVVFDRDEPGHETLNLLLRQACVFRNHRFLERLGAVLPCAVLEEPPEIIPTMTDAEVAAQDAAAAEKEEHQRRTVLTEWRQILDNRHLELSARLDEERIGTCFRAIRQELRKIEEARDALQQAAKAPVLPLDRLAEFHAQRKAAKAATVSPAGLPRYRGARKQASRRRSLRTQ